MGRHYTYDTEIDKDGNPIHKKGSFGKIIQYTETTEKEEMLIAAFRELKLPKIEKLEKFEPYKVATGGAHTAILMKHGRHKNRGLVILMGNNEFKQCGSDHFNEEAMNIIPFNAVEDICCGESHTLVVADKRIFTFGSNESGQLGALNLTSSTPLRSVFF